MSRLQQVVVDGAAVALAWRSRGSLRSVSIWRTFGFGRAGLLSGGGSGAGGSCFSESDDGFVEGGDDADAGRLKSLLFSRILKSTMPEMALALFG